MGDRSFAGITTPPRGSGPIGEPDCRNAAAKTSERSDGAFDCIAHIDLQTGRRTTYPFVAGDVPGEPIFVPRSARAPEGDGWVIAVVYRGAEARSDFVVFNADNIEAGPIGMAKMPRRVPFGFHGNWRSA